MLKLIASSKEAPPHTGTDLAIEIAWDRALSWADKRGEIETHCWDLTTAASTADDLLALHADGKHALRREKSGMSFVDLASGKAIAKLKLPRARRLALSPDCTLALRVQTVFDLKTGKELHDLGPLLHSAFLPGERAASVDENNTLELWDLRKHARVSSCDGVTAGRLR